MDGLFLFRVFFDLISWGIVGRVEKLVWFIIYVVRVVGKVVFFRLVGRIG